MRIMHCLLALTGSDTPCVCWLCQEGKACVLPPPSLAADPGALGVMAIIPRVNKQSRNTVCVFQGMDWKRHKRERDRERGRERERDREREREREGEREREREREIESTTLRSHHEALCTSQSPF